MQKVLKSETDSFSVGSEIVSSGKPIMLDYEPVVTRLSDDCYLVINPESNLMATHYVQVKAEYRMSAAHMGALAYLAKGFIKETIPSQFPGHSNAIKKSLYNLYG